VAPADPGHGPCMTTPQPETPQPRDIALEQETPEQAADLEAQSEASERSQEES
jgi:hypothetical protein